MPQRSASVKVRGRGGRRPLSFLLDAAVVRVKVYAEIGLHRDYTFRRNAVKREFRLFALPLVTLLALAAAPAPSRGDALSDRLSSAGSKAAAGRHLEAFEDLKAAEFELWRKMTAMESRRVVLVAEEPAFFGSFLPKYSWVYRI